MTLVNLAQSVKASGTFYQADRGRLGDYDQSHEGRGQQRCSGAL